MNKLGFRQISSIAVVLMAVAFLVCTTGCGDDDNGGGGSNGSVGEGHFDISGDIEGHLSGDAHFDDDYPMGGLWRISLSSDMEWQLNFTNDSGRPEVGSLELGNYSSAAAGDFGVSFYHEDYPDGFDPDVSVVLGEAVGTMEITESNDDLVAGTFEVSLVRTDDDGDVVGQVEITNGEFSANRR